MKKLFMLFLLSLKRQLKSKIVLFTLVGLPLVAFLVSGIPAFNEETQVVVGLVQDEKSQDTLGKETISKLTNGNFAVKFVRFESIEELTKEIKQKNVDHGFVFDDNLRKRFDNNNLSGSIIVISEKFGFFTSMTKEIVFSQVFKEYSPDIAVKYIDSEKIFADVKSEAAQRVIQNYSGYINGENTFYINFETISGQVGENGGIVSEKTQENGLTGIVFPLRGILAISIFISALFGAVLWKREEKKGVFIALVWYYKKVSCLVYVLAFCLLFAISSLLTLYLTGMAVFPAELIKMTVYVLGTVLFVFVLAQIINNEKLLLSIIPVYAVFCLIFCPVFINLGNIVPFLRYIGRLLLPYYYIVA